MGITPAMLRMLVREVRQRNLEGAALTLGTQDVWADEADVSRTFHAEGVVPRPFTLRPTTSALFAQLAKEDERLARYIHARSLFEMLGFRDYVDLDNSDRDSPTLSHDLNEPLPNSLSGRFDLIADFGTGEHVFRFDNVLASVAAAAKAGGVIIHSLPLPCPHWAQHGYYCFNPDVLWDFYTKNGFSDIACKIIYYDKPWGRPVDHRIYFTSAKTFDYHPGVRLEYIVPPTAISAIWFSARKADAIRDVAIPIQQDHQPAPVMATSRLRPLARRVFFAAQPFASPLLRRAYLRAQGVTVSKIR
jgi:SAM-dependent methyltransferase